MSILTDDIPGHWPGEAKQMIADLRRAYRALDCADVHDAKIDDDELIDDDIEREACSFGLTAMERRVWRRLRERGGRWVSKPSLYGAMYGAKTEAIIDKIVDVYICKIRKKLRKANAEYTIKTTFGVGYKVFKIADLTKEVADMTPKEHPLLLAKIGAFVDQSDLSKLCWASEIDLAQLATQMGLKPSTMRSWAYGAGKMPVARSVQAANIFKAKQAELIRQTGRGPRLAA